MPLLSTRGGLSALAFGMFSAKAGGTTVIVSFTAGSGTWLCPTGVTTADYLVVAGGGAAPTQNSTAGSGGGGAGGFRTGTGLAVVAGTSYTVTIGAGGATGLDAAATSGSNSVFSTITAAGGGKGGYYPNAAGSNGGSGGGGGSVASGGTGNTPSTSPSQGSNGGSGGASGGGTHAGGGGGGLRVCTGLVELACGLCGLEQRGARNNKSFSVIICYIGKEAYSSFGPFGQVLVRVGLLNSFWAF